MLDHIFMKFFTKWKKKKDFEYSKVLLMCNISTAKHLKINTVKHIEKRMKCFSRHSMSSLISAQLCL